MTATENSKPPFLTRWVMMPIGLTVMYALKLRARLYRYRPEPLERKYREPGPYRSTSTVVKDELGRPHYKLVYPANKPDACPIIVWGNGSDAQPEQYEELIAHLASWGFVVAANYCRTTGTGKEIAQTARSIVQENVNADSPLCGKLLVNRMGAVGQSQGATGVLNASKYVDQPLQTIVTLALPALKWCAPKDVYDTEKINSSMFFMAGTHDFFISPTSTNMEALLKVNPNLSAAMAMTKTADHLESMGDGGMHRGYLTAWLCYQLADDQVAAGIFTGKSPEIIRNKNWNHFSSQNLS